MNIHLHFLGGAGTVTGSKHLIEANKRKILIDCGLFQGIKALRLLNWENFPVNPQQIECVILTHGHLDHVGYLPLLVRQGFRGTIYANEPTIEIAKLVLLDSARIQEEDAIRANENGYSKHHPARPLYTTDDVKAVFPLFQPCTMSEWQDLGGSFAFRFRPNAHILGSSFVELRLENTLLVASGDVGRTEDQLMFPAEKPFKADILLLESTYGNRVHPPHPEEKLIDIIQEAHQDNGTIIIPSFAVERAQLLMYLLWKLRKEKKIPKMPIFLDSPMGIEVLAIFQKYHEWHKLSPAIFVQMSKEITLVNSIQETLELAADKSPKIVIAGSGMATGGRVLTYLEHYLADTKATILLAGYQAEGTRGRALLDGEKQLKMHGKFWEVKAKIRHIDGLSAHADQNELLDWLNEIVPAPAHLFLVHGEMVSALGLKEAIFQRFGWKATIPQLNEKASIRIK